MVEGCSASEEEEKEGRSNRLLEEMNHEWLHTVK
jgi:hypothetical protein